MEIIACYGFGSVNGGLVKQAEKGYLGKIIRLLDRSCSLAAGLLVLLQNSVERINLYSVQLQKDRLRFWNSEGNSNENGGIWKAI